MRLFFVVTLINLFQVVVAAAAEASSSGGLVDIGRGRKIYLECRGTGSPTVVLISGTRGAHDDWTDLIDPKNPNSALKPGEPAVFPQVSKLARVCAYDRPGTTLNDNTQTRSTPVKQPTTAQQGVADLHAVLIASREPGPLCSCRALLGRSDRKAVREHVPRRGGWPGAGRPRLGVSEELSDACAMGDVH